MSGHPHVVEFFEDEVEHRRQIARRANAALDGHTNADKDVTLTPSATSTEVPWRGTTPGAVILACALTQTAGDVLAEAYWFSFEKKAGDDFYTVTIHHVANPATDLNVRLIAFV